MIERSIKREVEQLNEALRRFEWVNFGSHGADAGCEARPEVTTNSPRRAVE